MNFDAITSVEFGVCRGSLRNGTSTLVPVDENVQGILKEMVADTYGALGLADGQALDPYEPSQEHGTHSKLVLELDSPLATIFREFHAIDNRPLDGHAMAAPHEITAYFCIVEDEDGNRLVAIRRSAQFKAVLEARLIQFIDDTFKAVNDSVFKLDHDFDVIIVDDNVLINRVAAFEFLAEIDEQVQAAAIENTRQLEETLPFVEFDGISAYVGDHKRAARVVAALRVREDLAETSVKNLKRECKRSGVEVRVEDGKLVPEPGYEMAFLQMLDRRRYAVMLVDGRWEQYEAGSRKAAGVREEEAPARPARRARQRGARG
jgi:hypothetical protein